jgi:hypothetical protein
MNRVVEVSGASLHRDVAQKIVPKIGIVHVIAPRVIAPHAVVVVAVHRVDVDHARHHHDDTGVDARPRPHRDMVETIVDEVVAVDHGVAADVMMHGVVAPVVAMMIVTGLTSSKRNVTMILHNTALPPQHQK